MSILSKFTKPVPNRAGRRAIKWNMEHYKSLRAKDIAKDIRERNHKSKDIAHAEWMKKVMARRVAQTTTRQIIAKQYGVHWRNVKLNGKPVGINTPFVIKVK